MNNSTDVDPSIKGVDGKVTPGCSLIEYEPRKVFNTFSVIEMDKYVMEFINSSCTLYL